MKKLNLAIIGQGRSGKNIHGAYYTSDKNMYYVVRYVVDKDEWSRKQAEKLYPGCKTFYDYRELFNVDDIDVVVNASYSYQHYEITKDLLEHKFNVLVEKPFARTRYESDTLIKTAKENGVHLAVFQQTFYAPYYADVCNMLQSDKLGKIEQISIRFNGFSRRWDWQTMQKKLAGNVYNTGPHPIGLALGFLGFDPLARVIYSKLDCTDMSSGDSDDFAKILIEAPNKPLVDVEINNTDAYSDYNVKVQGTKGTFKCTPWSFKYKYMTEEENPKPRLVEETLRNDEHEPVYCRENLITHEETGEYNGTAFDVGTEKLYEDMYYALTEGRTMFITAEYASQIVSVMETVHAQNPLPVKY